MTFLSDYDIRRELGNGDLLIEPLREGSIQPASIDLHLAPEVKWHWANYDIDVKKPLDPTFWLDVKYLGEPEEVGLLVMPGKFYLAATVEKVRIPANMVARVEGKSSLARLGIIVHHTAGWVDPGFHSDITLEITNHLGSPVRLYPGMAISQLSLAYLNSPAEHPYAGKYQGQTGPQLSQIHKNFTEAK